jgi:hypothetical protein
VRPKAAVFHFILTLWREPPAGDESDDDGWRGSIRAVTPRPEGGALAGEPFIGLGALGAAVRSRLDRIVGSEP